MSVLPRIEYIEARRVLLDVLSALREQRDAVLLVGTVSKVPWRAWANVDAPLIAPPTSRG